MTTDSDQLKGVAIIGMAGRFPGAANIDAFWDNLCEGVDSISFFSDEEVLETGVHPQLLKHPDYVKAWGVMEGEDLFDANFFGIPGREAEAMDPQHRHFLEVSVHALENAGYNPESYDGLIGLTCGVGISTYLLRNLSPNSERLQALGEYLTFIGNDKDFMGTRVAYKLNLRGGAHSVSTACSTTLVAVHLACRQLLTYESDMALAGGANIKLPQNSGYLYRKGHLKSMDGRCHAFDAKARGTVFGCGVAAVLLKRAQEAYEEGDHIYGIIRASAINNDGNSKAGYTAPSISGQSEVIAHAHELSGFDPTTITHIEAHGTGTELGDPCEIKALNNAFGRNGNTKTGYCALTSVKTNIGHLDNVGGVAGLIKLALSLKHRKIPPSLNFKTPNPEIDFENSPFFVNTELRDWLPGATPLRACISAFGAGGTNAHAVLEEAPPLAPAHAGDPFFLLSLSAKTSTALAVMTANLHQHLLAHPDLALADICFSMNIGRMVHLHRRALVFATREQLSAGLANPDETTYCITHMDSGEGVAQNEETANLVKQVNASPEVDLLARLERLAELWTKGATIDWSLFYERRFHHRIPLPNYPFESVSYWIDAPKGFAVAAEGSVDDVAIKGSGLLAKQPLDQWFYEPSWQRVSLHGKLADCDENRCIVVFSDSCGLGDALVAHLRAAGRLVVWITCDEDFEKASNDHYCIDPANSNHYNGVFTEMQNLGRIPQTIYHCWSVTATPDEVQANVLGFYSMIYLAQALIAQSYSQDVQILAVSNQIHNVLGDEPITPAKATLLATVRVIPQEHPSIHCRALDVVLDEYDNCAQLARLVLAEGENVCVEKVVALRRGRRWAQSWARLSLPEVAGVHPRLRPGGTYLVTGGLGGIGFVLAGYLAEHCKANLVLTGRAQIADRGSWDAWLAEHGSDSPMSRRILRLRSLEVHAARVCYYQADVTDQSAMATAVAAAQAEVGTIVGILHAAGLAEVGMILRRTPDSVEQVLAPKIRGTQVISAVFAKQNLDFVVMCSSLATTVGGYGQVSYVAANTYQDAFAQENAERNFIALNWDAWKEVGMAVNRQTEDLQLKGISNQEGIAAFERVLACALPQVAVSTHDLPERVLQSSTFAVDSVAALQDLEGATLSYPRPEMSVPYAAPKSGMENLLVRDWSHILGLERVGINDDFFELGGDSLKGMNVVNALEKRLGEAFHIEALFDTSTIAELAGYLEAEYPESVARLLGSEAPEIVSDDDGDARLDQVQLATFQAMIPKPSSARLVGPKIGPAVFVLAPPRSGSTLLRVILAGHPKLVAPPELFLLPFNTASDRAAAFSGQTAFWKDGLVQTLMMVKDCGESHARVIVEDFESKGTSIKELYQHLQSLIHREGSTRLLVDKTPSYAYHLETLQRAEQTFHNPLYIHLQRHPNGMINSYQEARLDVPLRHHFGGNLPFSRRQLGELLWHTCHQNIHDFLEEVPAERKHVLRFEDLLANPEQQVQGLCTFLGMDFQSDMLDPYQEGYRRMTEGINSESRMLGDIKFHGFKRIEASVAEAWREKPDRNLLCQATRDLAQSMGYQTAKQDGSPESDPSDANTLEKVDDMSEAELDAMLATMSADESNS